MFAGLVTPRLLFPMSDDFGGGTGGGFPPMGGGLPGMGPMLGGGPGMRGGLPGAREPGLAGGPGRLGRRGGTGSGAATKLRLVRLLVAQA